MIAMINFALFIFFFVIVIWISAILFFGWIVFSIARFFITGIWRLFLPGQRPVISSSSAGVHCPQAGCHAENPTGARFCRRCGTPLPRPQQVQVRRAAVW